VRWAPSLALVLASQFSTNLRRIAYPTTTRPNPWTPASDTTQFCFAHRENHCILAIHNNQLGMNEIAFEEESNATPEIDWQERYAERDC
jgi:hypothetical protein